MSGRPKKKFRPSEGLPVPDGIPTITVGPGSERRKEYLTPEKPKTSLNYGGEPPLPSLLSKLEDSKKHSDNGDNKLDQPTLDASGSVPSEPVDDAAQTIKAKASKPNVTPPSSITFEFIKRWGQSLLDVMRRREVDPNIDKPCPRCNSPNSIYRCRECIGAPLLCKGCICAVHCWLPLHWIERWTGSFFQKESLFTAGFVLRLGHHGKQCPHVNTSITSKLTVIHTNGVHPVAVQYCGCPDTSSSSYFPREKYLQLWDCGLWPATYERPQTTFSRDSLGLFGHLTMQAKISAYDFWRTLRRLTTTAFLKDVKDRYREFMVAHRQYSYLRQLKWFGLNVMEKQPPNSLALLCPACPQPGVNMDPDWESRPSEEWYIDALQYAKDGNFNLSQHDKKMDHFDPALTNGAAYYADTEDLAQFLEDLKNEPEFHIKASDKPTSTCSEFDALKDRYAGKLKSGQISLNCARHEIILPSGTVDLTKGEKYIFVDFITTRALRPWLGLKLLVSSYDVNCQYGIYWLQRLAKMIKTGVSAIWPKILRCVPKFHLPAHKSACRWLNSFYYMPGVGITDGEAPERRWSVMNALGRAVREMGSGHRLDIINFHYGDYNAQKIFAIGKQLTKKLGEANKYSQLHEEQLGELEAALRARGCPLDDWKAQEAQFVRDVIAPDARERITKSPYEPIEDKAPTTKEILYELNHQEATRKRKERPGSETSDSESDHGCDSSIGEQRGISGLLMMALEIERQQKALVVLLRTYERIEDGATFNRIEDARQKLRNEIDQWYLWHSGIMGLTISTLMEMFPKLDWPVRTDGHPEETVLSLPSAFPAAIRTHPMFAIFTDAELRIRSGQANEILHELRNKLGFTSFLWKKTTGQFGQAARTRSEKAFERANTRIRELREEYNNIRLKLLALGEPADSHNYRPLTEKDCERIEIEHAQLKPGQKTKIIPWIWRDGAYCEDMNQWQQEVNRLEWFRASARTTRWKEEVHIVEEEMRRTQRYFNHFRRLWHNRFCSALQEGASLTTQGSAAFAARQAGMFDRLLQESRELFPSQVQVLLDSDSQSAGSVDDK